MNFNLYILGNPNGKYKQMPDDYMASEIAEFLADLKGARLVIRRKMNLMHYIYLEKLDATKYIGICLIFNNAQVTRLKQLISLFRFLVEDYLINKGDIIRYGPSGELEYVIDSFSQNIERYKQICLLINDRLDNQSALYGVSELKTIFNGEHSSRRVGCDLNEEELLRMASSYNTLIVEDTTGMEQGYIPKVMGQLREKVENLKSEIGDLQQKNERLKKQKKQFKWVVTLLLCILVGIIAFVRYAQNKAYIIEGQSGEIDTLNMVITDRNKEIDNLNLSIERLRQDSVRQANAFHRQTGQLNTLRANVQDIHDALEQMPTYLYFPAWTSTNYHQPNSKSVTTYAFYANEGDVLNLPYFVSAEGCCDYLTIYLKKGGSSTRLVYQCGVASDTYRYEFKSSGTYQLIVSYEKDGSVDKNNDNAGVKQFYIYRNSLINLRNKAAFND